MGRVANKLGQALAKIAKHEAVVAEAHEDFHRQIATSSHLSAKMKFAAGTLHAIICAPPPGTDEELLGTLRALHAALTTGIR